MSEQKPAQRKEGGGTRQPPNAEFGDVESTRGLISQPTVDLTRAVRADTTRQEPDKPASTPTVDRRAEAMKVTRRVIQVEALMGAAKAVGGLVSGSWGLLADSLETLTDLALEAAAHFSIRIARKPPDEKHPHGRSLIEPVTAAGCGAFIFASAAALGYKSVASLAGEAAEHVVSPVAAAFLAAGIAVSTGMYLWSKRRNRELDNPALEAVSLELKSGALISAGALAGVVFSHLGYPQADLLAALGISIYMLKMSGGLVWKNVRRVIATAAGSGETDTTA